MSAVAASAAAEPVAGRSRPSLDGPARRWTVAVPCEWGAGLDGGGRNTSPN